ncbi:DUF4124 domain-containing protein [Hydrogenophaga sp.]|uniref:DUF4124 domain-containing protein n=1 Tax=Hydrogenophaga sp. TaxID=1904254 RepID=UPI00391A6473
MATLMPALGACRATSSRQPRFIPLAFSALLMGFVLGGVLCAQAVAQPVYRCETKGKVTYSHEPCVGAKVVDTTPTQGLDKFTGQSRKGKDVRQNEYNRLFDDAVKPLTGKSHAEMEVQRRRHKFSPADRRECRALDERLLAEEAAVRQAPPGAAQQAEAKLFLSRHRYRELRC